MLVLMFLFSEDLTAAGTAGRRDIRLVSSDASGVTLEYTPFWLRRPEITMGGKRLVRVDFAGRTSDEAPVPGTPDLGVRSVLLRFPSQDNNTVEIISETHDDSTGVLIAPQPTPARDDVDAAWEYPMDPQAYRRNELLPSAVAALKHFSGSPGSVLGQLSISPLQYNPALGTLRRYTRLVVRVRFGTRLPAERSPRTATATGVALNDLPPAPGLSSSVTVPAVSSVLSSGLWFRFNVQNDGIYRLGGQTLLDAGVPSGTDPRTIQIFSNGGMEVPEELGAAPIDDLRENAVLLHDAGTQGQLDENDEILFYARGTRGWNYDAGSRRFSHRLNHFSESNVYWVRAGAAPAKAMAVSALPVVSSVPPTVLGRMFREDEKINLLASGREWLGPVLNSGDQPTYLQILNGLDPTQPVSYIFHLGSHSSEYSTFTIREHDDQLGDPIVIRPIGGIYDRQLNDVTVPRTRVPTFTGEQSQLRISYSGGAAGNGYVDWYEIFYARQLKAVGDVFAFAAQDTSVVARYDINGFSGGTVTAFDVTRFDSAVIVPTVRQSADSASVVVQLTSGVPREICAVGPLGYRTPGALVKVPNEDLRGDTTGAEEVIVTHGDFMTAALRLKDFREHAPSPLRTKVVDVAQIFNEFGGGIADPAAIRNYLRYAGRIWTVQPRYLLLFGNGDYDYRRIAARGPNWMPPWETDEVTFHPIRSYASDDDFGILNVGGRVDLGIGRLPARSLQQANVMVDKIIEYESSPVEDPWKIRATFVADDARTSDGIDFPPTLHFDHAEAVAELTDTLFEKRKIYLFEYPTVFTPSGRRKPDVNTAIVNQINEGTLLLNYSGHGNPRLWAHEYVFVRENDFPLLHNRGRYFVLIAATCNFSMFDVIGDQSGGELLVTMPGAGAIASFSATRPVYAGANRELNVVFFEELFQRDAFGRLKPERLGDVVMQTKQLLSDTTNDRKYVLLGDPGLRIGFPEMHASVDSLNGRPGNEVVQLRALSRASVQASVRDSLNGALDFTGRAQVVAYDADRTVQINDPDAGTISYKTAGSVLFRGDESVAGGTIRAEFIVPKDISYRDDFGRMTVYFSNPGSDGAGYTTNILVGGTDTSGAADTQGPAIRLYLDHRSFRPGDAVGAQPLLIADLSDPSGINTSGSGVGHRLEAWIDDRAESIDLSPYYTCTTDRFDSGTVQYRLPRLADGSHSLRLRAWDTYNNSSSTETRFDVGTGSGLTLSKVLNVPNPFSNSTVFTFEHNQAVPVDAEVRIYTVAGRLIQSLEITGISERFVRIPWDGRDRDGDIIANGVYLYKIIARTQDRRFANEALGKLSVLR